LYSLDAGERTREGAGVTASGAGGGSATGAKPLLLTPGNFMCEHIKLTADKRYLVFSANAGDDPADIERRHVGMVSVDKPDMEVMTPGKGLEWTPVLTGDSRTLAFISATPQRPPLPAVMRLAENAQKNFTVLCADRIPADFPQGAFVTPRPVTFRAADGVIVHADLFEPAVGAASGHSDGSASGSKGGRRPAIVFVHGGPPRQMLLGWHYSDYYSNAYASNQYLASLGFVVLAVNYRLGIGYGYDFHQPAHAGPAGAAEYKDIKAAGEWLRRQSDVDTARIGIYGGSYGGFLTALALARDSRLFAAGVDFHGVHNWLDQSSLMTAFKDKYEKAPDYDKALKTAWLSSPVSAIATWKSPVLIIQGDDDRNVHVSQSIDLVNRLEKKGVPFETMMMVDDTHHWMNFANSVTVYAAAADFFVRQFMQGGGK
jgi:dipeptidyl aminopeptidase/acylaminoacyl peptidase